MTAVARGDVTAAVLAGGAARRFGGVDKGLVELRGRPLVAWSVAALAPQVGSIVIVANRNAERYAAYGRVVADAEPGYPGPLAGVRAALAAATTPWLLTVPVDCPQPGADLLARLAAAIADAAVAAAWDGERPQPLFALYRVAAVRDAPVPAPETPAWRWHETLVARRADCSDSAGRFVNLNTPDELARYVQARLS